MKWDLFVTWWKRFSNKWTRGYLVLRFPRFLSQVFSHGAFHVLFCAFVFIVTLVWAKLNMSDPKISQRVIAFNVRDLPTGNRIQPENLGFYDLHYTFDSDTLKKKTGYKDEIRLEYDDKNWHKNGQLSIDSILIYFFTSPLPDDLKITQNGYHKEIPLPYVVTDSAIVIKFYPVKNNDSPWGGLSVGSQKIMIRSNKLGGEKNSSYYNYYIHFESLWVKVDTTSTPQMIDFTFGDVDFRHGIFIGKNKNLLYEYIYPEPAIITNGYIQYLDSIYIKEISKNRGIIIQATDVDALNRNTAKQMISSVLVATGATLLLDILIQLVRELRNVNRRNDYRKLRIRRQRKKR